MAVRSPAWGDLAHNAPSFEPARCRWLLGHEPHAQRWRARAHQARSQHRKPFTLAVLEFASFDDIFDSFIYTWMNFARR
ncbi:hypothetical protein MMMB2_5239 [Mycobacterium marinum MB2]|nr:hypothetical protein MMMB2_5239 [Mycobacterium marinum MB2]